MSDGPFSFDAQPKPILLPRKANGEYHPLPIEVLKQNQRNWYVRFYIGRQAVDVKLQAKGGELLAGLVNSSPKARFSHWGDDWKDQRDDLHVVLSAAGLWELSGFFSVSCTGPLRSLRFVWHNRVCATDLTKVMKRLSLEVGETYLVWPRDQDALRQFAGQMVKFDPNHQIDHPEAQGASVILLGSRDEPPRSALTRLLKELGGDELSLVQRNMLTLAATATSESERGRALAVAFVLELVIRGQLLFPVE